MIDVDAALRSIPHFETYLSLEQLYGLVDRLAGDPRFDVRVAGTSVEGRPIHDVRFESGAVKALVVAGPQAMEPIGGLTAYSLLSLLEQGDAAVAGADVEWHVVPCIDPDAALLNEGWYTRPFTLERYVRGFWIQPRPDQVDFSFPVQYKELRFDRPSREAAVLRDLLDAIRPDFYYTLHNYGPFGGAWFALSRDLGAEVYDRIRGLTEREGVTLQSQPPAGLDEYAPAMRHMPTFRKVYDDLEAAGIPIPPELLSGKLGAGSYEHLLATRPEALVFVCELAYTKHPGDASERETEHDLRQLRLRLDADNKYLATVILEEWDRTHDDLDSSSPFYRKIHAELVAERETLHLGVTEWYSRSVQELLFNPAYAGKATEREMVDAHQLGRVMFLAQAHTFVRLLEASTQTPAVQAARERLAAAYDDAFASVDAVLGLSLLEPYDCDTLARVQLGTGLIALNSLLEAHA
jgi:hypothetical protein